MHCLNFSTQRQKRYDVTNDVKVNFLICGFVGYMKTILFVAYIFFYYPLYASNGIRRKVDTDTFCLKFAGSENDWPYFKNFDSC